MFRKKRPPAPASSESALARVNRMRPAIDARLASGDETDPARLAPMLMARSLSRLAEDDHAGALADADAALAHGVLEGQQLRAVAMVEAQAVGKLGLVDRAEAALARIDALPKDGVDPRHLEHARLVSLRLLSILQRGPEVRALVLQAPFTVAPGEHYGERLLARAQLLLTAGDAAGALEDVDAALREGVRAESTKVAANTGAYAIAVLGRTDRLDEALAWANLACAPGIDGADAGLAELDTRAAVLAIGGRGAEGIGVLEGGLARVTAADPTSPSVGWSHAFLARAHLDGGSIEEARRHADAAVAAGVSMPVLDDVRRRLAEEPPTPA